MCLPTRSGDQPGECNGMGNKIVYTRAMASRYQIVESLLWEPPPGVDPTTVTFHVDGWAANGRRIELDELMQRRADVIAEWYEPDEAGDDDTVVAASEDPLRAERPADFPAPVWLPIERKPAALASAARVREHEIGHDGGCVPFNGRIREGDTSVDLARGRRSLQCRLQALNPENRDGCQCGLDRGSLGIGDGHVVRSEDNHSVRA